MHQAGFSSFTLDRDNGHTLHVERHGTPGGIPTIVLHGGPGGGLNRNVTRTFDTARHDIVLFDQRGCGRSTPLGETQANTTAHLISDIEAIREHLGFGKVMIAGGSWGSFLALAYAQAHPDRVMALRVYGVFLGGKADIDWWFQGVRAVYPDEWDTFAGHVTPAERGDLLAAYYRRLMSDDPDTVHAAAYSLRRFSARTQTLEHDTGHERRLLSSPEKFVPIGRLFTHYCTHRAFMPEGALLAGIDRIRDIPAEIVQGRYDMVTPMQSAWELHGAWPEARFTVVTLSNHTVSTAMRTALREASDRLADRLQGRTPAIHADTIAQYMDIGGRRAAARDPKGTGIAFLSDLDGAPQIWLRETGDGDPANSAPAEARQLTTHDEPVNSFAWSPAGGRLVFAADCGGDERWQFHLLNTRTGAARALTADPATVHIWGAWSGDGQRIAYTANVTQKDQLDLYVMDVESGRAEQIGGHAGDQQVLGFSPDGESLLVRRTPGAASDQKLELVEIATGARRPVMETARPVKFLAARMLKAGGGLALCDYEGDRTALWRFDAEGRPAGLVYGDADHEVDGFTLPPDQTHAAVILNVEGYSRVRMVDLADGSAREVDLPFPAVLTNPSIPAPGDVLIATLASAVAPPGAWAIRLDGGAATPIELPPAPPALEASFIAPEIARFDSFDGEPVPFFTYTPQGPRPAAGWPTMFTIHGGPEMQWRPDFRADVQWLLAQGIAVVAPNIRGSTGYGRRYHGLDDRTRRLDALADVEALRAHLAGQGLIDAARCGIFGRSYGGWVVLAALTENPSSWAFGVDFYGIGNFFTHLLATGPWARHIRAAEYGDPAKDADLLTRISPIFRADRIEAPLLVVHADRDPRVPPGESEAVASVMAGLGKPCEFLRIAHAGHGFPRKDQAQRVFGAMARFIARQLDRTKAP